jgi:hypothetical protein
VRKFHVNANNTTRIRVPLGEGQGFLKEQDSFTDGIVIRAIRSLFPFSIGSSA